MSTPAPSRDIERFLAALTVQAGAGRFLDVRWRRPGSSMRRRFLPAENRAAAAELIAMLAPGHDVYVGVALRTRADHGGRAAIEVSRIAWVESDDARTAELLRGFPCEPGILIASGTPGHVQAYWLLDDAQPAARVEALNRRLAYALAGDAGCADISRILRPPGTLNHKHDPPKAVTLLAYRERQRIAPAELAAHLPRDPDPPTWRPSPTARRGGRTSVDRMLLAIASSDYARVLAGREPNREGKISCPFHPDRTPSLQLYPDGGFYCFGSSCRRGGTIFDFAGHLWGIDPRGAGFLEVRARLAREFSLDAAGREATRG
jgi:hypothetical protein